MPRPLLTLSALLLGCAPLLAGDNDLELVVLGPEKIVRAQLCVEVNGRAVGAHWEDTFDRITKFYDRTGDGELSAEEAARLPSAFALRQVLAGQLTAFGDVAPPWKTLSRNGKVLRQQVADYYRREGLGGPVVGVGKPRHAAALTAALVQKLDANGDKTLSEKELAAAEAVLLKLDDNEDELVSPGELVPLVLYPGATGAVFLPPPGPRSARNAETATLPLLVLPPNRADAYWSVALLQQRDGDKKGTLAPKEAGLDKAVFARLDADKDGQLTERELAAWRDLPPDVRWVVRLGAERPAPGPVWHAAEVARVRLHMRTDEGKLPDAVVALGKRVRARFAAADVNSDKMVDAAEAAARGFGDLAELLLAADRNNDGKLSAQENAAWADLQAHIAAGSVLVTVLDHGAGLFELLDADHDGALAVRELRTAAVRLKNAGCLLNGKFDRTKLPQQLIGTVSVGQPQEPLARSRRGPKWFQAMDRNGDGDVSRREFLGAKMAFDALDADGDGLVSAAEADKAK